MAKWEFEHSIYTIASRKDAWEYWSDVENHANMEPGVECIELDGSFVTGTTGRTIMRDYTQEWELTEVIERVRWKMTGFTPDGKGKLSFTWEFEDDETGTRMTQRITANETLVAQYPDELQMIKDNAPSAMEKLAKELDRLAKE